MSELKRGYKQTEVGVIPEDWKASEVGAVCGCIVPGRNKPRRFDGDIPWITTPDLEDGRDVASSRLGLCISTAEARSIGSKIAPSGSVLMSCAGELGIVALCRNELVVNQQLHVFLPGERITAGFLLSALSSRKKAIVGTGTKTAVPYLNKTSCNSIAIPLPPLPEQEAIAEALSDADALIESLEQLLTKKRHIKQGAMQELLTGKKRLPGFQVMPGYKQTEVGTIPEDWEVVPLRKACSFHNGRAYALHEWETSGTPVIRLQNLTGGESYYFSKLNLPDENYCEHGDLLYMWSATFGPRIWTGERSIYHYHIWKVTPCRDKATREYLYYWLGVIPDRKKASSANGGTMLHVTKTDMEATLLAVPTLPEQTAIASVLSDMDSALSALETGLTKARQLKQGMMQELLTGRIRLA